MVAGIPAAILRPEVTEMKAIRTEETWPLTILLVRATSQILGCLPLEFSMIGRISIF